jgi:hypothetical protein
MAQLEVLSWHLPERAEQRQKNPWGYLVSQPIFEPGISQI